MLASGSDVGLKGYPMRFSSSNRNIKKAITIDFQAEIAEAEKIATTISAIPSRGPDLELPGHPHRFSKIIVRAGGNLERIGQAGAECPITFISACYSVIQEVGSALKAGADFKDSAEIVILCCAMAKSSPKETLRGLRLISSDFAPRMGNLGLGVQMAALAGRRLLMTAKTIVPEEKSDDDTDLLG